MSVHERLPFVNGHGQHIEYNRNDPKTVYAFASFFLVAVSLINGGFSFVEWVESNNKFIRTITKTRKCCIYIFIQLTTFSHAEI